jgi:hypothetical protein
MNSKKITGKANWTEAKYGKKNWIMQIMQRST